MIPEKRAVILLAEDRPDDVVLIERALCVAKVVNPLIVVPDGEATIAYLDGVGKYADRQSFPLPDILLLDLKMPKMDGFEVLQAIKGRPHLGHIRIIVLTSSEDIFDVNKAYELGASSFLVKPLEFENFAALMLTLNHFWLKRNAMPGNPANPLLSEASSNRKTIGQN
jgi:CheY-like chemotaxis protein